ncbi:MAG: RpiB/LacA/LacB family sugar-phosphate isomerase [Lachnospiraceae bacterium]|nr:RpiB/LacA/LacB family sugar-phosphate isomerase [Lachnospiraceae bacterium]
MRVAVVNEVSAAMRNSDLIAALNKQKNLTVFNLGMQSIEEENPLSYIQTGIMSAILLNGKICDMVIGGCGTGQGYLNAVLQFPGVSCGLIQDPLDAWLFSQINGGNCVSLALHKGYGWAANINLDYMFEKLFKDEPGAGYPPERQEPQGKNRVILKELSILAHKPFLEILKGIDAKLLKTIGKRTDFMEVLRQEAMGKPDVKAVFDYLNGI